MANNSKDNLSKDQRFLYLQFHTKESSQGEINQLKEYFDNTFGEMSKLIVEDKEYNEIVYRVETPVMLDVEDIRKMFINIESVFDDFKDMLPHFTQVIA